MSNQSIHYIIGPTLIQAPAVQKTAQTSTVYDQQKGPSGDIGAPYEALELVLIVGAYTDGNHSWQVQDSPDNTTWTNVPAANLLGAGAASGGFVAVNAVGGQNAVQRCAYVGTQRYVRVVSTETGTTGLSYGLIAIGGYPRNYPTVASGS